MSERSNAAALASMLLWACGQVASAPPGERRSPPADSIAKRSGPEALQVGSWKGKQGAYSTIQAAVDAASPGDFILIAPGTYHETGSPTDGVRITKPGLHLRGLDRNRVVIDGTRAGAATCSSDPAAQLLGPDGAGRNGIQVVKADGVTIENLTACNFLNGKGGGGNQLWWNGGDGSGVIGMGSFHGAYLTASSTYSAPGHSASYGIFVSNSRGPGLIERSYASNMSDSGFYVGACPDCNAVLREVHAQNSPQGFSGSNAGGHLVLEDSEWDHNRVGIASTTLAADDRPSPQDGACPDHPGQSCTLIQNNYVHDNNLASTPGEGIAAGVPVGTGILISGGRNDTVRENLIAGNGAWGVMLNDYPDASQTFCDGGDAFYGPPPPYDQILGPVIPCYFHSFGNRVHDNSFAGNGGFGNPSNGDLANAVIDFKSRNCFFDNEAEEGGALKTAPANLQSPAVAGSCAGPWATDPSQEPGLFLALICDSFGPASGACGPADQYPDPSQTAVVLLPIPLERGMEDPCEGVPANSWCEED